MKNPNSSLDGFIPRRQGSELGEQHAGFSSPSQPQAFRPLQSEDDTVRDTVGVARENQAIGRADIDASLRDIDEPQTDAPTKKKSRREKRKDRRGRKPKSKVKRIIFWVSVTLIALIIGIGGYLVYKVITAGSNVLQGNILDLVQNQPLKEDENGRSNFLVFGTAEDDEGGMHGGANLTDSIMVISVDQDKKDAYMISLPRDLWVQYEEACTVGYQGKINAAYFCASNDGQDEAAGAAALQRKVGEILGLDVQYFIHMNFTAVVEAVDAVGGVDVTIESDDPRGILDRNFDWKCNYTCYYVNYENGEKVHLDGEHALALARARNAAGGYGLPGGNFDREKNQQKIIKALREKAVSAGTLTNLGAVTGLIDALGNNLRTNIHAKEIQTIMALAREIQTDDIVQLSLVEEGNMLVTTDNVSGQSIVRPVAGLMIYTDIQTYVFKNLTSSPVVREDPYITVLNGGRASGTAQTEADKLTDLGFNIDIIDNAPDGSYAQVEIYQLNAEKTASAAKLAEVYGVAVKTTTPPVSVVGESDFVIILGPTQ